MNNQFDNITEAKVQEAASIYAEEKARNLFVSSIIQPMLETAGFTAAQQREIIEEIGGTYADEIGTPGVILIPSGFLKREIVARANEHIGIAKQVIEEERKAREKSLDAIMTLSEVKEEMLELLNSAREAVRGTSEASRAHAYWIAHIRMALDEDHEWLGGSMCTLQDSIDSLREELDGDEYL